jgi:catechol 2,3-dioxygenase-like lactoylglutathione lyase family enzyme
MKRFHVQVAVNDLQENIRFYSSIFGAEPFVVREDYAKWMLDDPRINFAISTRGHRPGVNHLGIQVESDTELKDMRTRLISAQAPMLEEKEAACCYAKSDKYWITDPQGIAWETFHTLDTIPVFGADVATKTEAHEPTKGGACCMPQTY